MLNRSIVAPPFFKHDRTDKSVSSSSNLIDPWDRLDLSQISSIVPLVDPRKLKNFCGESFDVILQTKRRNNPMSRIEDVYNYSSMNFHSFKQTKRQPSLNSTTLPASGAIKLGTNVTRVRELWTSDEKCAFMLFPYHVINFKGIVNNSKKYAFVDLQREIVRATRRPKYIQEVVEKFFDSEIKEEYGALHWRYDPKDWFLHCDREKNEGPICSGKHIKVFTGKDLEKFIKQNYSSCPKIMKNFHDAFSLLEQEMCFKSRRFYPSTGSSWSLNVVMERIVFDKRENEDNYNLMKNI
ncbi:Oidioi.mRNA.OKI2018_I69.PAR.g8611.t1.cds [Oikopleura dioica]|uniref:Oidioi.mRNA.OKI2018_I69.PAR.g8611.t1.cds n=1 Tax=Oikopleura dioica TaxID=34765 RepID=A0ABN7RKR7_OIKDI|nr:Oidioi.mRNA.OKI2018_I69.PAR.g8611.t1.cds [Oikopleura dioica]